MNSKIKIITPLILAALISMAVAFSMGTHTGSSDNASKANKVTIGLVTFPGYAPLYLAKEKGFYDGLNVEFKRIESIGDMRAAFNSGNIDLYILTHDVYQSVKGTVPIGTGFLVVDESRGADGIVVSNEIKSIKDFKGKTVGAERGLPPFIILQYMLNKEGLALSDIKLTDLPTTDAGNAFSARKLDIAAIYEPSLSASNKARPGSHIIATSADIPGLIQDIVFAKPDFIKGNPAALAKIARGYFKAVEYIKTNPEESYSIMAKAFDVSAQEMKDFAVGIHWPDSQEEASLFDESAANNVYKQFNAVGDILQKNDELDIRVKPHEALTNDIIKLAQ